jgi:Bacterial SH3 domain
MFTAKRLGQLFAFMLLILGFQIVLILSAQADCETLVTNAFSTLSDTCTGIGGGNVCQSQTGEITSLSDINTLSTTMTDATMQLATMNIHANVPLGLSEEGMRLFLIGDVTVENAVDPATAFEPSPGATISTIVGANIRSFPSADGRLVTTAPVGTELVADGLNADATWIHVLTDEGTAWISRQIITVVEGDLDSLPVINDDTRTLWQDFYLSTTNDGDGCGDDFPPMLYIQGPDNMLATLTVNNIELRINSDIVLQIDENNLMQLYTIEGVARGDSISVPAGFTMSIQLSDDGRDRNGSWTNLRPIQDEERDFLSGLQLLPETLLYRPVEIPSPAEVSELLAALNQASAGSGQTVVNSVGQGVVDCSGFKPTSPLDALTPGTASFYWDGAPGAEAYTLNFYDVDGTSLGSVNVNALNPTYQVDPGSIIGGRGQFAWAVDAVVGGQVACTTGKAIVQRISGAQPVGDSNSGPAPEPTKCKWNQC